MKGSFRPVLLLAATLVAVPLSAQTGQSGERAREAANSSTQGQKVAFHLPADYSEFGHVLIASGTPVRGTVAHVARRSAGGNPGTVTVSVESLRAVDGTRVPLRGTTKVSGKNRQGQAAALGVLTFGIGATKKGLSAVIPAGTQFSVFTDAKRTIVVAR
jgi:hypothetical protein